MRAIAHAAILVVVAASSASSQSPEPWVVRGVKYDVAIDYDSAKLAGAYTMELENWTTRPASRVAFALGRLMDVRRVLDGAGHALRFEQHIRRFTDDPMRQVNQVAVVLPRPSAAGARVSLRVEYSGYVVPYTEIGWLYVKDHIDTAFTILRMDALAFPEIQGLNDAANRRRPRPDVPYEASVRVPSGYVVATGGSSRRTSNADGTVTWTYRSGKPSPFMNIAIARSDTLNVPGLKLFFFPADSAGARYLSQAGDKALRLYTEWFGRLRDEPTVTVTEIPDDWGSQASAVGGIIQTASAFRDTMQVGQVYHELAHLWNSGGGVESPSPRWNEGLSMFLQGLTQEKLNGWPGRRDYTQRLIERVKARVARDSMVRAVPMLDYGKKGVTGLSYSVGAVMFAALYDLVGEQAFLRTFADLYRLYPAGATTRDMVELAKRSSPVKLDAFFDDWVFTTRWTGVIVSSASLSEIVRRYAN